MSIAAARNMLRWYWRALNAVLEGCITSNFMSQKQGGLQLLPSPMKHETLPVCCKPLPA